VDDDGREFESFVCGAVAIAFVIDFSYFFVSLVVTATPTAVAHLFFNLIDLKMKRAIK